MNKELYEQLMKITEVNSDAMAKAKGHWDSLGKPLGSLGDLEAAVIRLAGITGDAGKISLEKKAVVIFCGDHGVVEEGVTQTGQEVTRIVAENFTKGTATVNTMSRQAGADVFPIDIGMKTPDYPGKELEPGEIADYKISRGTGNLAKEPAMTKEQCEKAILSGIEIAGILKKRGYDILVTGEMGIGNTTPTSALAAVWLGKNSEEVTGRGAGLSKEGYEKKQRVVERAVKRVKQRAVSEPIEILAELGGYEIAGMTGLFLGGAIFHIPVVIDGVISAASAFAAARLSPLCQGYMMASHESREPAGKWFLQALKLHPFLVCRMAPGEGCGGVAVLPLLEMALSVYQNLPTFEEIGIEAYQEFGQ